MAILLSNDRLQAAIWKAAHPHDDFQYLTMEELRDSADAILLAADSSS